MTVRLFFDPDLVFQLATCGITARREAPAVSTAGFIVEHRRGAPRERVPVTNVIAVRDGVTITGPRQETATLRLLTPAAIAPQTALALVEECDQLRRDNRRLTTDVERLRDENARLIRAATQSASGASSTSSTSPGFDDSMTRFALLELD